MIRIHKEGLQTLIIDIVFIIIVLVLSALYFPTWLAWLALFMLVKFIFLLSFFRNPLRAIPNADDKLVYAPADGKVVVIEEVKENEYIHDTCIQISIFMSPLNVHVNRYPFSGTVDYVRYHPGKYLVAWHPKSSTENERSSIGLKNNNGKRVLIRQIAGAMARRIVFYPMKDQKVKQGEDLGFIKFGSRVDIFLPLDASIHVNIGDTVKGNLDIIAKI
jgi:phosphatidylserine decarboxylase